LERLGLGAAALAAANPELVLLSMSGPGRGSSVEALRSYGLVLSALGGAEALIARQGRFLGSPTFSLSDPNAALFAAMAALAGAIAARASHRGVAIDLSQIEAAATLAGTASATTTGCDILTTGDGRYLAVELPASLRLDQAERLGSADALAARIAALGGRAAPVLELPETDSAPIFADCGAYLPSSHPVTGEERLVAAPWRVNGQRPPLRKLAPLIGEGNDWVLRRVLGLGDDEIAAVRDSGGV
jgi:crotonobetainyl-CoA:carnitine CoA-transferase CaiB-like acyl-CoA transferase